MESKVIAATHESLMAPDWANYVELSDTANANVSSARAIAPAVVRRLASPNPKVVVLALTLADSLLKNGTAIAVGALSTRELAAALRFLAEGRGPSRETQSRAASLVQELGVAFSEPPALYELPWAGLLQALRAANVPFPLVTNRDLIVRQFSALTPPAPPPRSRASTSVVAAPAAPLLESLAVSLVRVRAELRAVRVRVVSTARMLVAGGAHAGSPDVLDELDYFDQVTPRLHDLVEACVSGAISDADFFESCLSTNEAVARVLDSLRPLAAPPAPGAPAALRTYSELRDLTQLPLDAGPGPQPQEQRPGKVGSISAREQEMAGLFDSLSVSSSRAPPGIAGATTAPASAAAASSGMPRPSLGGSARGTAGGNGGSTAGGTVVANPLFALHATTAATATSNVGASVASSTPAPTSTAAAVTSGRAPNGTKAAAVLADFDALLQ